VEVDGEGARHDAHKREEEGGGGEEEGDLVPGWKFFKIISAIFWGFLSKINIFFKF
jgi:hypothetical protein